MKRNEGDVWFRSKEQVIKHNGEIKTYYRYLVEEYIGKKIPEGFVIHHIDWNHKNNTLENFLIIPANIHNWIHRCKVKDIFVTNLDKFK